MSRLPAHIIDAIRKRREQQKEQRPFLEIPAPDPDEPTDPESKDDDPKKDDKGVIIIDLSIGLHEGFEVMP